MTFVQLLNKSCQNAWKDSICQEYTLKVAIGCLYWTASSEIYDKILNIFQWGSTLPQRIPNQISSVQRSRQKSSQFAEVLALYPAKTQMHKLNCDSLLFFPKQVCDIVGALPELHNSSTTCFQESFTFFKIFWCYLLKHSAKEMDIWQLADEDQWLE